MTFITDILAASLLADAGPSVFIAQCRLSRPLTEGAFSNPIRILWDEPEARRSIYRRRSYTLPWVDTAPVLRRDDPDATRLAASAALLDLGETHAVSRYARFVEMAGRDPEFMIVRRTALAELAAREDIARYETVWFEDKSRSTLVVREDLVETVAASVMKSASDIREDRGEGLTQTARDLAERSDLLTRFDIVGAQAIAEVPTVSTLRSFSSIHRARIMTTGQAFLPPRGEFRLQIPVFSDRSNRVSFLISNIVRKVEPFDVVSLAGGAIDSLDLIYEQMGARVNLVLSPANGSGSVLVRVAMHPDAMGEPSGVVSEMRVSAQLSRLERIALSSAEEKV